MAFLNWHRVSTLATICVGLIGCERAVPLATLPAAPLLVVQARLDIAANGGSAVSVVHLTIAEGSAQPTPATSATIQVRDDSGSVYVFAAMNGRPGTYVSAQRVAAARTFTLSIVWQGDTYEAVEHLPRARPIERIAFVPGLPVFGTNPGTVPAVDFTDLAPGADFYQWELYHNGRPATLPDSLFFSASVRGDSTFNGQSIKKYQPFPFFNNAAQGTSVRLRQATLSTAAGAYLTALQTQRDSDGSPFERPPFNLRGNVVNRTSPARRALGVFAVRHIWEETQVVP